jgi:hypothetical protein
MAEGGKKDAAYISGIFEDPKMSLTDVIFFDGASSVQKAGQVLVAKFPRTFCFHGGNMLSLSSSQILQELSQSGYVRFYPPFLIIIMTLTYLFCPQLLILKTCRMYNVFGSGPTTLFMLNSWPSRLWPIRVARWDCPRQETTLRTTRRFSRMNRR